MSEETIITAAVQLRYRREHYTSTLAAPKYLRYILVLWYIGEHYPSTLAETKYLRYIVSQDILPAR